MKIAPSTPSPISGETGPLLPGALARIATPLTMVLVALCLLVSGLALALHNDRTVKAEKVRQASVQAQILASSVVAPLAFDDSVALQEYLNALRANPEILAAGAYDAQGRFVAGYTLVGTNLPDRVRPFAPVIAGRDLTVTARVTQGDTAVGIVYLRVSLESWPRRAARYLGVAALIIMACLLVAVLGISYASLRTAHTSLREEIASREKVEEALRQSQKLEAMGQLTGGVAHDFNNLLMVATSGLDLMERTTDPEKIERLKAGIRQAVDRGAKLTQQLLTFARRSPLHPEVINLRERLTGMDALLERSLGEGVTVDVHIPAELWVEVDPSQLEVAVLNIALNARDAMPKGGFIRIRAKGLPGSKTEREKVRLSIADNGTGIAPEMLSQIFEPFFTTKGVGRGTGLGLSQVYGFAKSSGGEIEVESTPGEGTTISLVIPRATGVAVPLAVDPAVPLKAGANRRILLVEDDDTVAEMVGEMLGELGYESERAETADAALVRLEEKADFEMLLSDMVMPGTLNGIDLVHRVAERWPRLPAMLMTGYSAAAASAASEGIPLLVKPYTIQQLSAELEVLIGGGR
ncbi:ATP-binding protein [Sphingobium sufflavum]|uniref:ATP-binding protein n=1 Tax=Sphingobium sufflavum TaxID=1129547 RepID=UPI001F364FB8|nr:ATP-binding protein [Sphingobium sufflavum]MCE7797108.1 ATP-binding protein [Sphingobium sufflavum]